MKKSLYIAALCFLVFIESQAQVSFNPGLRGGANFSKITQTESSFKTDFYVGAYGALRLGRLYTLQPEIAYSNQGGGDMWLYEDHYYYGHEPSLTKKSVTISYVSISVINKFNFTDKVNFHLGPVFDIEAGNNDYTYTPVDIAFTAGLGYNITNNLALEGRIKKGIVDVFDSYYHHSNSHNMGSYNTNFLFQLGLSYTFDIQNSNSN
jgi:hypothetical protein